jgi:hypothetical protein
VTDETPAPPFDEEEALAQLERLRAEIVASRLRREALSAEFDEFVRSFQVPPPERSPDVAPALSPGRAVRDVRHEYDLEPPDGFVAVIPEARAGSLAAGVLPVVLAGGTAFLLVTAVLSARFFKETPEPTPTRAATARPAPTHAPVPPAGSLRVELRTLRPVWARAFVDGRKAFERELPAGQRVPLQATRVIVVRAGDAGAIRISVDGKDQGPLGPDGRPVTRLVTASPR